MTCISPHQLLRDLHTRNTFAEPPSEPSKDEHYELFRAMDEYLSLVDTNHDLDPDTAMTLRHISENIGEYTGRVSLKNAEELIKRCGNITAKICQLAMTTTRSGPQNTLLAAVYQFILIARSNTVVKTWRHDKAELDLLFSKYFTFVIPPKWFLDNFLILQENGYRETEEFTGNLKVERWKAMVRAAFQCRNFWNEEEVATMIIKRTEVDMIQLDTYRNWFRPLLLHCMVSSRYAYVLLRDGRLFNWWNRIPCGWSELWDSAWLKLLSRGLKYGWAVGNPLDSLLTPHWPRILTCMNSLIANQAPVGPSTVISSEAVEWEYPYFTKEFHIDPRCSLAAILVYSLRPITQRPADAYSLQLDRDLKSEFADLAAVPVFAFDVLEQFMKIIAPYCHPNSATGRLETELATFVGYLTAEYVRRIGKERFGERRAEVGMDNETQQSIRLGRLEDLTLAHAVFNPAFEGVKRKVRKDAGKSYLAALLDCCSLCPEIFVPKLTAKLVPAFDNVSEPWPLVVALAILGHMAKQVVIYQPQIIPVVLSLAHSAMDVSDGQKAVQATITFEGLLTWAPAVDFGAADFYGFDWTSTLKVLTPMFGYKTIENRVLFSEWESKMPFDNLRAYPDERLHDDLTQLAVAEAPDIDGEYAAEEIPCGYQNEEQIQKMITLRVQASQAFTEFLESYLSRLLDLLQRLKVAATLPEGVCEIVANVFRCACSEVNPEFSRSLVQRLISWVIEFAKEGDSDLYTQVMKGIADCISDWDVVGLVLDETEKVLIVNNQLNPNMPFHQIACIGLLIVGTLRPRTSKYVTQHMARLAKLTWLSLHYFRTPVFEMGTQLFGAIVISVTRPSVEGKSLRQMIEDGSDTSLRRLAFQWGVPWWMQLNLDETSNKLAFPSMQSYQREWHVPTDCERDLAYSFMAQVGCGSLEKLLEEKLRREKRANFGRFDAKLFREELSQGINSITKFDLPEPRIPALEEIEQDTNEKAINFMKMTAILQKMTKCLQFPVPAKGDTFLRRRTPELPLDPTGVRNVVLRHTRDYIFSAARHFVGMSFDVDKMEISVETPQDSSGDLETADVQGKLVSLAGSAFQSNIWGYHDWRKALQSKAYKYVETCDGRTHVIKSQAFLQSANTFLLSMVVKADWSGRVGVVEQTSTFAGERKDLLLFLYANAVNLYSAVRQSAQETLSTIACLDFQGMTPMLNLMVTDFIRAMKEARELDPRIAVPSIRDPNVVPSCKDTNGGPPLDAQAQIDSSPAPSSAIPTPMRPVEVIETENKQVTAEQQLDVGHQASQTQEEKRSFLLHVKQTGCSFMLMSGHYWRHLQDFFQLTGEMLLAIVDRLSVTIELETLKNRLLYLSLGTFYNRQICPNPNITCNFLVQLVNRLDPAEDIHWRAKCVALAYLASNMSTQAVQVMTLADRERLFKTVILYCNVKGSPQVGIVASYSLLRLLKMCLTSRFGGLESLNLLLETPSVIQNLFALAPAACTISEVVPKTCTDWLKRHIQRVRSTPKSFPIMYRNENYQVPERVTLHFQTLLQSLFRFCGPDYTISVIQNQLTPLLMTWVDHSTADTEVHWAVVAAIGGLIHASRKWDIQHRTEAFKLIAPALEKESQRIHAALFNVFWSRTIEYIFQGMTIDVHMPKHGFSHYRRPDPKEFPDGVVFFRQVVNLFMAFDSNPDTFKTVNFMTSAGGSGEDEASSQADCRYLLLLRTFLRVGKTYIPGLVEYAASFLVNELAFSASKKKVREELAATIRMYRYALMEAIRMDSLANLPVESKWEQALNDLDEFIYRRVPRLLEAVKTDAENYRASRETTRPPELSEAKLLLNLAKRQNYWYHPMAASERDVGLIELAVSFATHSDEELNSLGQQSLASIAAHPRLPCVTRSFHLCLKEMNRLWTGNCEWSYRWEFITMAELLNVRHRVTCLGDPNRLNFVLGLYERGLKDENSKVSRLSKTALARHAALMSHAGCEQLCKEYLTVAGAPAEVNRDPTSDKFAAIQGLGAVIRTCALDCPYWLPATITQFARFGSARCPDKIRSVVELTLQEFFKTHLSDWEEHYKLKFTESQTEVLNEHKGIPVYFS